MLSIGSVTSPSSSARTPAGRQHAVRGRSSKPALGEEIEGERNVDDAPGFVNSIFDYQRSHNSYEFLESQVMEILKGLAEIQRDPFQPLVDAP